MYNPKTIYNLLFPPIKTTIFHKTLINYHHFITITNNTMGTTTAMIQTRFSSFLIHQSIQSTIIYILYKTLISPPTTSHFLSFIFFHLSLLLFSTSLFIVSSPQPVRGVSLLELLFGVVKLVFVYRGQPLPDGFRVRVRVSFRFLVFVVSAVVSGFGCVVCLCGGLGLGLGLGFRGLVIGLFYGVYYVFKRRWVLEFPIVQRPLFFSYKMGVRKAIVKAVRLSSAGYLVSLAMPIFIKEHKDKRTMGSFFAEQMIFYFASFVVFLCWELNCHLLQVFLTERYLFAPTKGSAAAETNPSDHLLAALEESTSRSLIRYLAYLDLCMVSESNVDTWRRAAFFEETGETYKKVIGVCLKPLEQLTLELSEGLGSLPEKSFQLSNQLRSSNEPPRLYEPFYDHQICAWCARIVTSLTIRSHKEDRFGVAQLSGCNAATTSTLLACLLAVEAVMGKKTNLQSSNQFLMGPADIKWAALGQRRKDITNGMTSSKKDGPHYAKAYYMADILRTSIYQIVSNFHHEMVTSSKNGLLEKDWITTGKPLYGSRELLVHKLKMFLEFQAN
ncbi:Nucleoporin protein Ndc1-Nup [Artemisia annua]|uniref:Nucleoporin protein Ndc1-Nup n=1 Tax=Artemisia annua TaxID=35608 RepID=A0A2U1Q2P5_ARTAN|nr:Nucleoporin protein Ndc1-Nup [Artemisia annua]